VLALRSLLAAISGHLAYDQELFQRASSPRDVMLAGIEQPGLWSLDVDDKDDSHEEELAP
jgi:hypothetical protein